MLESGRVVSVESKVEEKEDGLMAGRPGPG